MPARRDSSWDFRLARLVVVLGMALAVAMPGSVQAKGSGGDCKGRNLLSWLQSADPDAASRVQPTPSEARNDGAVLYEITKGDLPPSTLFGTVHLTDPRVTKLTPATKKALKKSKILALEVAELSPKATSQAVSNAMDLVLFDDGKTLDGLLSEDEFAIVADRMEDSDTPQHLARLFKPWVVSMIMSVSKCERKKIAKGGLVLDMKLAETARKASIPVVGLETIKSQLEAAAQVPLEQQLELLRASIVYAERADDLMETVLQLYLNRQVSYAIPLQVVLAEKAGIDGTILRRFRRDLIERRNAIMAERAEKLLAEGGAFIAVGALHLPGRKGLVAKFKRLGYTVIPIE
ncbi:MAG: TraB/GumN family protein [Pseudomonadota bacterium]